EEGVKVIQLWGFTDKHSWIPGTFRGQGWALPWDAEYKPKPALDAIKRALGAGK
ncbi:MAG: endo-1,4-beta-xylanase, partial [Armatimonadetes bacterium]|nr:endo-1,4-beta-xylanase [Armatimonadota bacterium]